MVKGVWVYIEQTDGKAEKISWELLGKGKELAKDANEKLFALVIGHNMNDIAKEAVARGADEVFVADHELLHHYKPEVYTKVATEILQKEEPNMLIIGATHNGRDLAGKLALTLHTGLTADVVKLEIKDGLLIGYVPGFGGSILAMIKCETARPQMATARPGLFAPLDPDPKRKGKIHNVKVNLSEKDVTTQLVKTIKVEGVDISGAKRLVAAGRGIANNLEPIKELAKLLEAEIGVTRPLCDVGLFPRDHQVGSTGVTVKPKFAINFGISGAAHYVSGIQNSDVVISINIDPEATIFEHSDYQVVGDANEILPELLAVLKERLLQEAK